MSIRPPFGPDDILLRFSVGNPAQASKNRRMLLFLFLLLAGTAWARDYESLLRQAQRGDPGLDFVALRQAFTRRPDYNGYSVEVTPLLKALAVQDWVGAEKQARTLLISNYLQLDAHYVLLLISRRRGDKTAERQHDFMLRGLSLAIREGHDGSGPEKAWKALNVAEEYAVCRLAGWKVQKQEPIRKGEGRYDRLTVVNGAGKTFPIYFDITDWAGRL